MSRLAKWMTRDPRQEALATKRTKALRAKLNRLGVEWGLGVFPNVETVLYVETFNGVARVEIIEGEDGEFTVSYLLDGLTANEAAYVAASGVTVRGQDDQQDE